MQIRKETRSLVSYYPTDPHRRKRAIAETVVHGPFSGCGNCPYAAHGFLCYSGTDNCLKTAMEKNNSRRTHQ